ncbi:MAG: restriction endonuclease subunit S [Nitrospinae bacterium]|nr:restriction endonuclease subunit S [Nitrospinota bacterium]
MSKWKEYKLGDLISINAKSIDRNYPHEQIEYLDTGSITRGKIEGFQLFDIDHAPSRAKRLVKDNDIIYSTVHPIQRHYGIIKNPKLNLVVSTGFAVLSCDEKEADARYIYYFLTSDEIVNYMDMVAEGSTSAYPSLTPDVIEDIDILLPPLPEQKSIASILSSLDDKIDLLHRQNKTLEALAETLFRQWFVEKAEENLETGELGDYVKVQGGYAFKSKDFKETGFAGIIKITNISMGIIDIGNSDLVDESVVKNLDKRFKIKSGDFLIAMTGAEIGKIGIVEKTEKEIWLNQRVGKLEAKVPYGNIIGYLAFKSREGQDHIINACSGSAQENISTTGIEEMIFASYDSEKANSFGQQAQPFFDKIIFNLNQIRTLTRLRDTLLPKVMSGEVRVRDN